VRALTKYRARYFGILKGTRHSRTREEIGKKVAKSPSSKGREVERRWHVERESLERG